MFSAKVRSRSGQKSLFFFKFMHADKKGVYLDQFLLRNIMVSIAFTYDATPKSYKNAFEK